MSQRRSPPCNTQPKVARLGEIQRFAGLIAARLFAIVGKSGSYRKSQGFCIDYARRFQFRQPFLQTDWLELVLLLSFFKILFSKDKQII